MKLKRFTTNQRMWEAETNDRQDQQAMLASLYIQACSTAWGSLGKSPRDLFLGSVMYSRLLCPVRRTYRAKTLIAFFLFDNLISLEILTTDTLATLLSAFMPQGRIVMSLCRPYACSLFAFTNEG